MVLSTIEETPSLHVQTRFTPKATPSRRHSHEPPSTRNNNLMPFSTRNVMNGGPISTSSIVFSMNPKHNGEDKRHFFTTPMAKENGFSDIFRKWEDASVKSQDCDGTVRSYGSRSSRVSGYSRNSLGSRAPEGKVRAEENESSHRKIKSELPRMDDWMNDKLNKYEKYTVKKMESTLPQVRPDLDVKKVKAKGFGTVKLHGKGYKDNVPTDVEFEQQRDDVALNHSVGEAQTPWMKKVNRAKPNHHDQRDPPPTSTTEHQESDYDHTMRHYRTMGLNETLQKQVSSQSHEISTLHQRLDDMEQYYKRRLGEMSRKLEAEEEWMSDKEKMEREILRLTDENHMTSAEVRELRVEHEMLDVKTNGLEKDIQMTQEENRRLKGEVDQLTQERNSTKSYLESLERDLNYHKNEWQREKEANQSVITNLRMEHEKEKQSAFHEINELRLRLQSANRELEERAVYQESEWKARLQSVTRELEEEMTRCAVITKDKNAMADKMEDYISKMEKMQRHNRELERENRELMMMNRELEAKNTMIDLLSTEKHALDDAMDGSLAQIAELQKRNAELEKETTMLKEELIDVLEVASHYQ